MISFHKRKKKKATKNNQHTVHCISYFNFFQLDITKGNTELDKKSARPLLLKGFRYQYFFFWGGGAQGVEYCSWANCSMNNHYSKF